MGKDRKLWRKVLGWNVGDRCIAHIPLTSIRLKGEIRALGYVTIFRGREVPAAVVCVWRKDRLLGHNEMIPLRNLEEYHE